MAMVINKSYYFFKKKNAMLIRIFKHCSTVKAEVKCPILIITRITTKRSKRLNGRKLD